MDFSQVPQNNILGHIYFHLIEGISAIIVFYFLGVRFLDYSINNSRNIYQGTNAKLRNISLAQSVIIFMSKERPLGSSKSDAFLGTYIQLG